MSEMDDDVTTEIVFMVGVRRVLLSAVAMLDKRIEFLHCIPVTAYDIRESDTLENTQTETRLKKVTGLLKMDG